MVPQKATLEACRLVRKIIFKIFTLLIIIVFSTAINRELANFNVKVHMIIPFYVKTNMTRYLNVPDKGNLFSPNAKVYVKSAVKMLGKCAHTSGYWCHSIQVF